MEETYRSAESLGVVSYSKGRAGQLSPNINKSSRHVCSAFSINKRMQKIEEYILKSQDERQTHLRLDEPCIERGGQSMYLKGLLAHLHETTIPSGKKIHVCHACHNAKCSNPNHLYWGTASENRIDAVNNGAGSVWESMVKKYGEEEARKMQARSSDQAAKAGRGNKGKPKTEEHKRKIAEAIRAKHRDK